MRHASDDLRRTLSNCLPTVPETQILSSACRFKIFKIDFRRVLLLILAIGLARCWSFARMRSVRRYFTLLRTFYKRFSRVPLPVALLSANVRGLQNLWVETQLPSNKLVCAAIFTHQSSSIDKCLPVNGRSEIINMAQPITNFTCWCMIANRFLLLLNVCAPNTAYRLRIRYRTVIC